MGSMKVWNGTAWETVSQQGPVGPPVLPVAGATGQVLAKQSAADFDVSWQTSNILRFADAATRTAQLPSPVLNQLTMLGTAPGRIDYWNGSAWVNTQPTPTGIIEGAITYSPALVVPPNSTGAGYVFNINIPRAGNLILDMNAVVNQSGTNGYQVGYLRMGTASGGYPVSFGPTSVIQDNAANFGVHTLPVFAVYNGVGAGTFPFRLGMDTGPGPASLRISEFFGVYRLSY